MRKGRRFIDLGWLGPQEAFFIRSYKSADGKVCLATHLLSCSPSYRGGAAFPLLPGFFATPRVVFCFSFDISYNIMNTLCHYPLEFGILDDEYHQFQTSVDDGYQNNSDSMSYFDVVRQPSDQIFEESYNEGSNPYPYPQSSYPAYPTYSTIASPPSTTNTESPVEEFQYIDYQSYMTEPQASLNVSYSPVGAVEGRNDLYYPPHTQQSNAASGSPAPKQKKSSRNVKASKPPHSRHVSYTTPSSSHSASPREGSTAAEPSSNVNSRPTKKSKGPPKNLLTVFDSNIEPHARKKSRSAFSEEAKKKVEAVRRVGACTECRCRKRMVN